MSWSEIWGRSPVVSKTLEGSEPLSKVAQSEIAGLYEKGLLFYYTMDCATKFVVIL